MKWRTGRYGEEAALAIAKYVTGICVAERGKITEKTLK
jgi:hypothetical protein